MTQAGRTGDRDFDNADSGSGRLSGCTIGGYYNDQGKAPCEDVGTGVPFLNNAGGVMSDTTNTGRLLVLSPEDIRQVKDTVIMVVQEVATVAEAVLVLEVVKEILW